MATRIVTTDPKQSNKSPDYYYVRFNDKTPTGTEKTFSFPKALAGIISKNYMFDDSALKWIDPVGWVLQLDFDAAPTDDPQLPPNPEAGWSDPDHLTAIALPEPAPQPVIPNRGVTPQTARKHAAAALAAEHNLPVEFLERLWLLGRGQNFMARLIGVSEKPRPEVAQRLVVTAFIDYCRGEGVNLGEQEEKLLRTLAG